MHIPSQDVPAKISRRIFLRDSAVAAITGHALSSWGESSNSRPINFKGTPNFQQAAIETARWIRTAEKKTDHGSYWLPEPDHPEKLTTVSPINGIYSGSAGIILFFLQLAQATKDPSYLEDARRGADFLLATWRDVHSDKERIPGLNLSFYNGLAGLAFVLGETWRTTGTEQYRDAATIVTQYIADAAYPAGAGVAWSAAPGVIGDGSILLYLLYAADAFRNDAYLKLAERGGLHLLEIASPHPAGGLSWRGVPSESLGLAKEAYFPNFELGTAGVAFVLARLHEETGHPGFLDAAKQGALHLQKIATVRGAGALIPYRFPDLTDLYYLGFCHGPAGTARLFYELYKITRNSDYLDWTEQLAHGVIDSNIPENQTPGFWNVVCQCCGSAGVTDFFLGLWAATGKQEYYAFANRVINQALSRQSNLDGKGIRWYQAWTRVKPWEVSAETGYSIGAAGVGTALLHTALAQKGQYQAIHFPDNPFPNKRLENAGKLALNPETSQEYLQYLP